MPRTLPTERLTHNGTEYTISFEWALECKHCGHYTRTASEADRISCGNCNRKNPRDNIAGKYFDDYLKYSLFTGEETATEDVTDALQRKINQYEAMETNGWEFDCTTGSSHVAMSKGDVPAQQIHA